MSSLRVPAALLTAGVLATMLAACGSDGDSGSPATGGSGAGTAAAAPKGGDSGGSGGGGGDVDGPCDLTDQSTVASVFPGVSGGKPGKARNCEFKSATGTVNLYYFEDLTLAEYKKQELANDIKVTDLSIGDGGFRDQLGTVAVGKDDYSFAVQFLPASGLKDIPKYQSQTVALATKIFAGL